ncbi:MAG: peptide chain release factor 1 [Butyricimonas faecihominis]|jgi:peptide chain release factor 1|uniref:Peptide chain release factor 1 n=4 Tax=Butyricimonas TaxID=574697 RepID=A0A413ILE3_9BACT|nr:MULTISPECIES: peptide chain release factor 1 [Butyricimonas]MBS5624165.1 peptide chain release factor 1 [Porphyromonadaceae bacterium]MBS6687163.1 peptide chain release factor 1 [Sanguibacteroides justesenii]OKZ17202.1 MAG: peptide chain release factor 1 [Butyricimonas synergistica]KAB1507960.1 peptide chain release factor 1 [Butyricimonas faecihominis]MBB4026585.1 peptide chain release factor 1 [Butyricimonas faecihominis]
MSDNSLLEKLETFYIRFREIGQLITDPEVIQDMNRFVKLNKEYRDLEQIVEAGDELKRAVSSYDEAQEILNTETDKELKEMAEMEIEELDAKIPELESKVKMLLVPADPEDSKNVILEIRAGTGGDEASLFAGDLFRMYTKFCESKRWKIEITNYSEGTSGGYKEIVANITGDGVYGIMKYESGVHRVQRVPATETQGRVHTSAATVAVLPEAEEVDVVLNPADIRKDTYCSSGPGGQSVNTTYSAIRLTHIPTGIVVTCQDEKSQLKNLAKAMTELRSRIYAIEHQKYLDEIATKRKTMVSTGDRSAKIRTYNYPQGRVTDHRINLTLYNLAAVMDGELGEIIEKLQIEENTEKLKESGF